MHHNFTRKLFLSGLIFSACIGLSSVIYANDVHSSDWLSVSHDKLNTANNPAEHKISSKNAKKLQQIWEVAGASIEVIPAVAHGKVYYTDFNNVLSARKVDDGSLVWSTQLNPAASPRQNHSPVLIVDDFLFVGLSDGNVYKVNRINGQILWSVHPEPDPTLVTNITGGLAYAKDANLILGGVDTGQDLDNPPYTFRGSVFALDANTGNVKWRFFTTKNDAQGAAGAAIERSTPAIDSDLGLMYIGTQSAFEMPAGPLSAALIALNYKTNNPNGELVWKYQFATDAIFSLSFPNGNNVNVAGNPNLFSIEDHHGHKRHLVGVAATSGVYAALDRKTGELIWTRKLIPDNVPASLVISNPSAAFADDVLYTAGYYDPNNLFPGPVFIASTMGDPTAIKQGIIAVTSGMKSRVQAIKAKNGKVVWQKDFDGVGAGAPITHANGVVYFDSANGILRAMRAKDGKVLKTFETPTFSALGLTFRVPFNSGVSISHGKIFTGYGLEFISGGFKAYKLNND